MRWPWSKPAEPVEDHSAKRVEKDTLDVASIKAQTELLVRNIRETLADWQDEADQLEKLAAERGENKPNDDGPAPPPVERQPRPPRPSGQQPQRRRRPPRSSG